MTTVRNHYVTPAEAIKIIKAARGVRFCLYLTVRTYDDTATVRADRYYARTYLDITRKQAVDAMQRFANSEEHATELVCIDVADNTVWIG